MTFTRFRKTASASASRAAWPTLLPAVSMFALAAAPLPLHAQTRETDTYKAEIDVDREYSSLLNNNLQIVRHASDKAIAPEEIQRLAAAAPQEIRELLSTEGYFSPSIGADLQHDGPHHWIARYRVDPGIATRIASVDLRFSGEIAEGPHAQPGRVADLRSAWSLKSGERFRQAAWSNAKDAVLKSLSSRDFPAARITGSEARIDPDAHTAALMVEADSGPLFTFGKLDVRGLKHYPLAKVERLNPIKPGEPYWQDDLTLLQSRLQDSGYFRSAFATIDVDPAHPDQVPVQVDVSEMERRSLAFGVGYSTDAGPHTEVKWTDRQFAGRNWMLQSQLQVDRLTQTLGADLFFPQWDSGWSPSIGGHFQRTDISGEIDDRLRTDARITGPDKRNETTWTVSYLTEKQSVADVVTNYRRAEIITYGYTLRRVDDLLAPHRGYVASVELSAGPAGLVNRSNLARMVASANWLSPTEHQLQAQLRGQFGRVTGESRQEVPSELLFRTGGDQTVRGYAFESLGIAENGAVVGGRVMAVASAEMTWWFKPQWGAAVFHDAGNAADSLKDFHFEHGTGVGARWRSPIGAVNLDVAYGHATRQLRLHFSIGYGF